MENNKKETALEEQLKDITLLLAETLKHVYQLEQFVYEQHNWLYAQPKYQGKIKF